MAKQHEQRNADILGALNIQAEYRALGVEIVGSQPNAKGWLQCRAIDREDRNPSAAVNVSSGYYVDLGGGGSAISFWDFAAQYGPHADWQAARKHYADRTGVQLGKGRRPKKVSESLAWQDWNDMLVSLWVRHKPGVTLEAVKMAGGRLARYPAKSKLFQVVALPVFGSLGINAEPVNWVFWHSAGRNLPRWDKKSGIVVDTVKMKSVYGASSGLMGFHALARLAADDGSQRIIWKTAGPTDMMALWSLIPPERRDTDLVLCNSHGENQNVTPEMAAAFTGHDVRIVHDADVTGEAGAAKWLEALAPITAQVRHVRLPYPIVESHGKDLRDWIQERK